MNAFDKAFIKAYGQKSENQSKLMPLSEAIELSRDNMAASEIEEEANTYTESPTEEMPAEDIITMESPPEYQTAPCQYDASNDILPMPSPEFQPLLQVDAFAWPKACERFEATADDQITDIADYIEKQARNGHKLIGFMGEQSGSGCTTLLLSLARRLAERCRVALVDANHRSPGLSRNLGLLPDVGLKDVAAGTVPLDEALIESLDDHLSLLPYAGHAEADYGTDPHTCSIDLGQLASHYDLVLVDLGAAVGNSYQNNDPTLIQIDASVIVQDVRGPGTSGPCRAIDVLQSSAVDILGIVENRTSGQDCANRSYASPDLEAADAYYDAA